MKSQFRKGFRQTYKGIDYVIRTIKLDASQKIILRDEIIVKEKKK